MKRYAPLGLATFFLAIFVYQGVVRALLYPLIALPGVPGFLCLERRDLMGL
jgi:hypothetical protein